MVRSSIVLAVSLFASQSAMGATNFIHPGARYGKYELDFVKGKIAQGAEPWSTRLRLATMVGSDSRALGMALNWYHTGNATSATTAIGILRRWNTHDPYEPPPANGGNQSSLEGAWAASVLAPAAELLSLYPGWADSDKQATKQMFRTVFLPAMMQMSYWNGNVDLTQIDALLSIAVFLEDTAAWNEGIRRLTLRLPAYFYLSTDKESARDYANGAYNWSEANGTAPVQWIDGIMQESCRDNGHHGQFAIAAALEALETAYLQGVDLYTPNQKRMVAAMELLAKQLRTKDMQGACNGAATTDRYNTLEVGYNHYHNRKGVDMPETWTEIVAELRNGAQQFNMFHETLTNGDIAYPADPSGTNRHATPPAAVQPTLALRDGTSLEITANATPIRDVRVSDLSGAIVSRAGSIAPGATATLDLRGSALHGVLMVALRSPAGTVVRKVVR